jgi:hypothetical protein
VVLSRGDLKQPVGTTVDRTSKGVKFSWQVTKADEYSHDQVMLLVYFPHDHSTISMGGSVRRLTGTETIPVDAQKIKQRMETYICFVSNNRQQFSDSLYVGGLEAILEEEAILEKSIDTTPEVAPGKTDLSAESITYAKILDVARNLRNMGLADPDIATVTGLNLEEIKGLDGRK